MKPKGYSRLLVNSTAITAVMVATFAAPSASATSATWNGTTDTSWTNVVNWAGPPATVPGAGEMATFNNAGNGNTILNLGAGVTIGSILFDTSSTAAYTIGSGAPGSQILTLGTNGTALTMNPGVATPQTVNAAVALPTTGTYAFTNNSASPLSIAGPVNATSGGVKTLTVTGTGNVSIGGNITNGTGTVALAKTGTGTLGLGGTNLFTGALTLGSGRLSVTAGTTTASAGFNNLGNTASTSAVTGIDSGAIFTFGGANGGNLASAASASAALYNAGTFNQTATTANNAGIYLGNSASAYGYLRNSSGATATVGGRLWIAHGQNAAGATGVLDITGGTVGVNSTANYNNNERLMINGDGNTHVTSTSYAGVNITGGTLTVGGNAQTRINIGQNEYTSINITGAGSKWTAGTSGTDAGIVLGETNIATNIGTLSISNGGTLEAAYIYNNSPLATGVLTFDNGTIRSLFNNSTGIIQGTNTKTYLQSGGVTFDTNGFATTVQNPLLAPTGNGVNAITIGGTATGYVGAPVIKISGGGGTGAAAVANFDPTTGAVTGVTITSPGSGYTSAPVITLVGGNGGATGAGVGTATATATIAPITGGGIIKTGAGALTLTSVNTYTGATTISGGSLVLGATADVNSTTGITVNGTGAKLVQNSLAIPTFPVTVTNGTVDGTRRLLSVAVGNSSANVVTHGDTGTGSLTIDNLTFNDAATINLKVTSVSPEIVTTTLTTGSVIGAGKITINASSPAWAPGDYDLISYTTLAGGGFSEFQKGTITGLSGRQSATLGNPTPGYVSLIIAGDNPVWNGALSGDWTTATLANPKNWSLITSLSATDYIEGDFVLFDDTATGTSAVNISSANVSPTTTTFNNTGVANGGHDYVISSSGGFGIAGGNVTLNGVGPVTLETANTYAGGTFLNAGTLRISNASAIGTGVLTIAGSGGKIDTAGTPITLSTNNSQNWNSDFSFLGSSDLNLGTGAVTLGGDRTVTTEGSGTLAVGGPIGGGFGLTKAGAGTLVLTGTSSVGNLKVSAGSLKIGAGILNVASTAGNSLVDVGGTVEVATGATLNVTGPATSFFPIGNTAGTMSFFSLTGGAVNVTNGNGAQVGRIGGGTLTLNSGTFTIADTNALGLSIGEDVANSVGTVDLNGGTLAVVKIRSSGGTNTFHFNGGTFKPTATNNTDFFPNLTTLNTEVRNSGAIIDTNGFNITIRDVIAHSTVGGDNAIDGGVTKNGIGTLVLSGANAYTGNTIVNGGTLSLSLASLADTSAVVIGATGVLDLQHGATDQVAALTINGVVKTNGTYDSSTDPGFITGSGKIRVGPLAGYSSWASAHGLTVGVNDGTSDDPDLDGINNLLEYVLGGNPIGAGSSDTSILPARALDASNLTLTFRRSDLSESDTLLKVQYSTNFTTWSDFATIGAGDALPGVDVTEDLPTADLDTVVVKIPRAGNESGGKLFGRIDVVKP